MEKIQNKYEVVMVFSVQDGDDSAKTLYERFKTLIEGNATIDNVDEWGRRRLAYPIQDQPDGYYYLVSFTSDADFPTELDRVFKITDGTLRSMIIRKDEKKEKKEKNETA